MASAPRPRSTRLPDPRHTERVARWRQNTPAPPPRKIGGDASEPQPALLDSLLRILRVRKWWVLQALVLVPIVVALLTLQQEKRYTAASSLLFRDVTSSLLSEEGGGFKDPVRDSATNDALIGLPVVAEETARRLTEEARATGRPLGIPIDASVVAASVTVSPSVESDLVSIEAESTSGYAAARMANAYGESYIQFRQRSDRRQFQEAIDLARKRLAELDAEGAGATVTAPLRERLDRLELQRSLLTGNAELVQRATPPTAPSSPNMKRNLIFGLMLGGVLGLALAAVRERLDRSIKTDDELESIYGTPVLVRLPRSRKLGADGGELAHAPEAEAFRMLRANLRYFDLDGRLRSILVSSPQSGDGKSTVARNLARTMAHMGDHVVFVEADLHKPASPTLNGRTADQGLSAVLSGVPLDDCLVHLPVGGKRHLTVLPAGPLPPNPVELLESNRMLRLLDELERRFELVIIDSPALSQVSDARPLVGQVSGVLIVSALEHTTREAAVDFRKQLELLEGPPLGVVANLVPNTRSGYYYASS